MYSRSKDVLLSFRKRKMRRHISEEVENNSTKQFAHFRVPNFDFFTLKLSELNKQKAGRYIVN